MARLIKTAISEAVITFTFGDGAAEALVFDTRKASEANNNRARMHGWVQRIADAAALDKGASVTEKREAMAKLVEFYEGGGEEWNLTRTAGGGRVFDVGAVVTALARVKFAGDVDRANKALDAVAGKKEISRTDAAKLFAADKAIGEEIDRMKREARKAPAVDADSLLGEIEEGEGEAGEPEAGEPATPSDESVTA